MKFVLGSPAQDDLIEIAVYLNAKASGLGDEFLDDVDEQLAFILEFPEASAVLYKEIRQRSLRKFRRHGIFYTIRDETVHVLRVLHHARSPRVSPHGNVTDDS